MLLLFLESLTPEGLFFGCRLLGILDGWLGLDRSGIDFLFRLQFETNQLLVNNQLTQLPNVSHNLKLNQGAFSSLFNQLRLIPESILVASTILRLCEVKCSLPKNQRGRKHISPFGSFRALNPLASTI